MTREAYEKDIDARTIPVVLGRGKSGEAKTGPARFLVDTDRDRDALSKMHNFLARYYDPELHAEMGTRMEFAHTVTAQVLDGLDTDGDAQVQERRLPDGVSLFFVHSKMDQIKIYDVESYSHRSLVKHALDDGRLSIEEAEALGHFNAHPSLRQAKAAKELQPYEMRKQQWEDEFQKASNLNNGTKGGSMASIERKQWLKMNLLDRPDPNGDPGDVLPARHREVVLHALWQSKLTWERAEALGHIQDHPDLPALAVEMGFLPLSVAQQRGYLQAQAAQTPSFSGILAQADQFGRPAKNVAKLLHQLGLQEEVMQGESFHARLKNPPYLDLVIERHPGEGDLHNLYLTHYIEQGGDLIHDGEMVFQVGPGGHLKLSQTAVQNPIRGGELRGLDNSFASMFSTNLITQGFGKATIVRGSQDPGEGLASPSEGAPKSLASPSEGAPEKALRQPTAAETNSFRREFFSRMEHYVTLVEVAKTGTLEEYAAKFEQTRQEILNDLSADAVELGTDPREMVELVESIHLPWESLRLLQRGEKPLQRGSQASSESLASPLQAPSEGLASEPENPLAAFEPGYLTNALPYLSIIDGRFALNGQPLTNLEIEQLEEDILGLFKASRDAVDAEVGKALEERYNALHSRFLATMNAWKEQNPAAFADYDETAGVIQVLGRPVRMDRHGGAHAVEVGYFPISSTGYRSMVHHRLSSKSLPDMVKALEKQAKEESSERGQRLRTVKEMVNAKGAGAERLSELQRAFVYATGYAPFSPDEDRQEFTRLALAVAVAAKDLPDWAGQSEREKAIKAALAAAVPLCQRAVEKGDYHSLAAILAVTEGFNHSVGGGYAFGKLLEKTPDLRQPWDLFRHEYADQQMRLTDPEWMKNPKINHLAGNVEMATYTSFCNDHRKLVRKAMEEGLIAQHHDYPDLPEEIQAAKNQTPKKPAAVKEAPQVLNPNHFTIGDETTRTTGFSPKARFEENVAAIRLLRDLEISGRPATAQEKSTLVKYNGWGGLPTLFERNYYGEVDDEARGHNPWVREGRDSILPELLEKDEYDSARSSVNNAHFTTPDVTRSIWEAVRNLGFAGGRVLETSMGAGAFLGTCPEDLVAKSKFVGVEKDSITGRLAKQIYPDADIRVEGFEETKLPNNFFDLAISNVPFGDYQVFDPDYAEHNLAIHDYFIVKALDKIKPGGVAALITSSGTMDKLNKKARRLMAEKAELAGAIRLPDNTHEAQAGTRVTTDILFFRKRTRPMDLGEEPAWVETGELEFPHPWDHTDTMKKQLNTYFLDNPEHVLGTIGLGRGQQGRYKLIVNETTPRQEALPQLVQRMFPAIRPEALPEDKADDLTMESPVAEEPGRIFDFGKRSEGSFILHEDGKVYQVVEGGASAEQTDLDGKKLERLIGLIGMREAMDAVFLLEKASSEDTPELAAARLNLNEVYNRFAKAYGALNDAANRRLFVEDPDFGRVMALEIYDDKEKTAKKADIFFQRVVTTPKVVTSVDTPHEALLVSMNTRGRVDLPLIASLCGQPVAKVAQTLKDGGDIFLDPNGESWVAATNYLSGNVKVKLKMAKAAAAIDPITYGANVAALEEVQPADLTPKDIELRLGAPWVPTEDVKGFVGEVLNISPWRLEEQVSIRYRSLDGAWVVDIPKDFTTGIRATSTYGTSRRPFHDLLERALNQQSVAVYDPSEDEGGSPVLNAQETILAQQKLDELQQVFRKFLWEKDEERAERLVRIYNDRYNNYVPPRYDGSFLTFPGMSATIELRPHQKNAVWRALQEGNTLFAHDVGTGKTMVQIATAMEMKRLGKSAKPWIIIPNHMLDQFDREARQLYPGARILSASINDLSKQNRKRFVGKLVNNDWDMVIMTHSMFGRIGVDPEFESRFIGEELIRYRLELEGINPKDKKDRKRFGVKKIEAKIKSLEAHLKSLMNVDRDSGVFVGDLNLDALLVDESHNYKNLAVDSSANNEVSASISGSQRAWDMFVKTRYIFDKRGETSGVCFSSGTPVSNHVMEFYNIQRYLQPQVLEEMGLNSPSAWAGNFLTPKSQWEPSPSGSGWKVRTRYAMHNLPELMQAMRVCMDVVTAEETGIRRPEAERKNITTSMSRIQRRMMKNLDRRVRRIQEGGVDPSEDNLLKIVSEGRQMALEPRLLYPDLPDHPESKVNLCVNDLYQTWQETTEILGTQLVFCDLGTPSGKKGKFNVYHDIREKLVAKGIPREEIAFIHEYPDDKAKGIFFQAVREGKVRIVLGSTAKMGEGTNVQDKIVSLSHLDAPWRPKDIEQRDGRAIRQGNTNDKVERRIYTTEDTFDLFMWSTLKIKAETFGRVIRGDTTVRKLDLDIDPTYAETAAITSNDTLIKEKLELEQEINRLELLSRSHADGVFRIRRLIRGYQDEIGQLQEWKERLEKVKEPVGEEAVWTLDLRPFGFESEFSGDREALLALLGKLFKSQKLSEIEGVECCGVPVRVEREFCKEEGRHKSVWFIGDPEDSIRRFSAANIEEVLAGRSRLIRLATTDMEKVAKKIEEAEGELAKGFEFDDRLVECKARHRELLQEIEAEAKRRQEAGESDDDDEDLCLEDLLAEMEEEGMIMRASA